MQSRLQRRSLRRLWSPATYLETLEALVSLATEPSWLNTFADVRPSTSAPLRARLCPELAWVATASLRPSAQRLVLPDMGESLPPEPERRRGETPRRLRSGAHGLVTRRQQQVRVRAHSHEHRRRQFLVLLVGPPPGGRSRPPKPHESPRAVQVRGLRSPLALRSTSPGLPLRTLCPRRVLVRDARRREQASHC